MPISLFNFYGQDSGSLISYYLYTIRDSAQGLNNDYVILRSFDGNPYIYLEKGTDVIKGLDNADSFSYNLNLSGDFLGLFQESVYGVGIKSGQVKSSYDDLPSYSTNLNSGEVNFLLKDAPKLNYQIFGSIDSGDNEKPIYSSKLNSGEVHFALKDLNNYSVALSGKKIEGISMENCNYNIYFNGSFNKIYKDKASLNMSFYTGKISRGNILFQLSNEESASIAFSFEAGAIRGSK